MAKSNLDFLTDALKTLHSESYRVVVEECQDDEHGVLFVSCTVKYDKIVDGVQVEYAAYFTIHWVSEHLWCVEISNGSACWEVITEINPIAAFYMAVGFEYVNE